MLTINNTPPVVNNNVLNPLLDKRTKKIIIKEAQKIDAKLILMINKNADENVLKEISRQTNSLSYYGKTHGKTR